MIDKTIRELREDLGWTQANLAKHLGVADKAIKNWEGGSSKPSFDNAIEIAKLFCVSLDYLAGLEKREPIYVDQLPVKEQRYIRGLVQYYTNMVMNDLKSQK